jgi:hypothetical protein
MTESAPFPKEVLLGLLAKLDELELTTEERDLLRAILTVARDVTEGSDPCVVSDPDCSANFSDEFASAFTASKAELIRAYADASHAGHHLVTRSAGAGLVTRSSPALVTRLVTRGAHTHTGTHPDEPHDESAG